MVEFYARSSFLVLIDLNLIVNSPLNYFIGGIGDTLAKWYEAEGIVRHYDLNILPVMTQMGLLAAKKTHKILFKNAQNAIESMKQKKVSDAFKIVTECVIAISGMVGGYAGSYGSVSGAHAIHNAMSFVTETQPILHGLKVAYGILVQLIASNNEDIVKQLLPYYHKIGLPYKLSMLNIENNIELSIQTIAKIASSKQESFKLAVPNVNEKIIIDAIHRLEKLVYNIFS